MPVAAGPSHIVQLVNGLAAVWQKDGSVVSTSPLQAFFHAASSDGLGDPKVLFDAPSGRWFASAADFTTGAVLLAVSSSSGPTSPWSYVNLTSGGGCPDQPLLGLSDDKVVLMANVFASCTGSFLGGEIWAINKTDLVSGSSPRMTVFGPNTAYYSVFPVQSLSPMTTQYMARVVPTDLVRIYALTGVPPGTVSLTSKDFTIASFGLAVDAVQQGSSYLLDTGDTRVRDAFWKDGRLWLAFNDGCTPASDSAVRSCFRLTQIDTTASSLVQDFDVGAAGTYYVFPSLREDAAGNLIVVFGYSSSNAYPSVAATYREPSDPGDTLHPPLTVRTGTGPETPGTGYCNSSNVCRWGDYYGTGVDPADNALVWSAAEYGTSAGWATYISAVRISAPSSVTLALSYTVQGAGTGYAAPVLTYVQNGTTQTATLSGTPTAYVVDFGSSWSVTNPLGGSTISERWSTNQPTSGTATADAMMTFAYARQFAVVFTEVVVGGGTGYSSPTITYVAYGATSSAPAGISVWADSGTSYAYPTALPGSSQSEAWRTLTTSGAIGGTGTITVTYDHQYSATFGYTITGSGSGYTPPSIDYTQFGAVSTTSAGTAVWVDATTPYAFTNPLGGSGPSERWISGTASGTITSAGTVVAQYYHQLYVSFTYTVSGGGTGYSAPNVTYANETLTSRTTATGIWVWADAGSTYLYQNPLPGSTTQESWRTKDGTGTITNSGTYTASYRHQFRMNFKAKSPKGTATPETPLLNVTQFDTVVTLPADSIEWVDAGGWYSFPGAFYGPLPGERWITDAPPSGQVLAPGNVTAIYLHQFFLLVQVNSPAGGTVSAVTSWYNESASVALQAAAASGWRFEGWIGSGNGSYSGASGSVSVRMDAPLTETAVFYAGLTLTASSGGTLSYSYAGTQGWVPPASTETIYVAPGTSVSIAANPSWFYEFQGWSGLQAGGSTTSITINAPLTVSGGFGVSLYSKPDSVAGGFVLPTAVVALVLGIRHRRRKKRAAAFRAARARALSRPVR